jgi:Flp pilus assembly pilin Flp
MATYDAKQVLADAQAMFEEDGHAPAEYGAFSLFVSRAIIAFERDEGGLATASVPGTKVFLQELLDDWKAMDKNVLDVSPTSPPHHT